MGTVTDCCVCLRLGDGVRLGWPREAAALHWRLLIAEKTWVQASALRSAAWIPGFVLASVVPSTKWE